MYDATEASYFDYTSTRAQYQYILCKMPLNIATCPETSLIMSKNVDILLRQSKKAKSVKSFHLRTFTTITIGDGIKEQAKQWHKQATEYNHGWNN